MDRAELFLSVRDYDITMDIMNDDLLRIQNWCFQNLLLLNPDKTNLMVFGNRKLLSNYQVIFASHCWEKILSLKT